MKLARSLAWIVFGPALCVTLAGCGSSTSHQAIPTPSITGLFPSNVACGKPKLHHGHFRNQLHFRRARRDVCLLERLGQINGFQCVDRADFRRHSRFGCRDGGIAQVTVANPSPGGPSISGSTFTIEPVQAGEAPSFQLFLRHTNAGKPAFTLTVNGSNFAAGDVATWNGTQRAATFMTQTQMSFAVTQDDITNAGL